jgi:glycerophosphoryl diester phosphodiesterase
MRSRLQTEIFDPPRPRVIGHRGCAGTHPENTMPSFRAALDARVPYIELDIHATLDGVVVVSHDANLDRTCGVDRPIREMTWDQLAKLDAAACFTIDGRAFPFRGRGARIPRLDEVLSACPRTRFLIEVKQSDPSVITAMLAIVDDLKARRRVMVVSELQPPLDEIRRVAGELPTNLSYGEVADLLQAMAAKREDYSPPGDALQVPPIYEGWKLVTPESIDFAHRHGLEVHVWTVNEEHEMRELLDMGVDGIISDYPARLMKVIAERSGAADA